MPSPAVQKARPEPARLHPSTRGGAVLVCYLGIIAAVVVGYLLDQVVATPLAAVVFVLVALAVVVWLHPAFVRWYRARRTR